MKSNGKSMADMSEGLISPMFMETRYAVMDGDL